MSDNDGVALRLNISDSSRCGGIGVRGSNWSRMRMIVILLMVLVVLWSR
jgi:hypothetical protein